MENNSRLWKGTQWCITEDGLESLDGEIKFKLSELTDVKTKNTPETISRLPIEMAGTIGINLEDFITAWLVSLAINSFDVEEREMLLEGIELARKKRKGL